MQYEETILLFYVIACSGWTICPDARNANRHYKRGGGINIGPKPKPPTRPKAPSGQVVEASYEDGYVYLNFKYSEGPAVLYVFDFDGTTLRSQHMFSTDSEAAVYIGNVSEAYLLVETSNGHEYEGWIY